MPTILFSPAYIFRVGTIDAAYAQQANRVYRIGYISTAGAAKSVKSVPASSA